MAKVLQVRLKGLHLAKAIELYDSLEVEKSTHKIVWDKINQLIFPNSEQFLAEYSGGAKRRRLQFDNTAERALEIYSSSMVGLMANPTAKFINFEPKDKDLLDDKQVQLFVEEAQDKVLSVFNDPATKFHDNFFYCVQYLGAYGTTALLSDRSDEHVAVFRAEGPKSLNFTENFNNTIDEVFLERKYTIRQLQLLAETQGWDIPFDKIKKKETEKECIIRHIYPNPNYDKKNIAEKRYKSDYYLKDKKKLVHTSGFDTFPAPVGRWGKLDGEKWGDSPGRVALTAVRVLNASERHLTFAEEYSLRPSLFVSSEAKFGKLNLSAGAVNVGRGNPNDTVRPLLTNGDTNFSLERNRQRREVIMQSFYVDIFQTMSDIDMTATEAQIRQQERLRGLAPKVARIQSDILGPTAERVLAILIDQGKIKVPEVLRGRELEVTYISPLAQAQRAADAMSIQMFMNDVAILAQGNPDVLDKVDFDFLVDELAEIRGIPTKALLPEKELSAIREDKAKQLQLQNGLALAQQAGDAGQAVKAATNGQ